VLRGGILTPIGGHHETANDLGSVGKHGILWPLERRREPGMRASRETLLLILCAGLGLLAACSRKDETASTSPAPASAPSSAAVVPEAPAVNEPPAESGLAIKRGIAMIAQDRMTFRPCEDKSEWWLVDQTDGVLTGAFKDEGQSTPLMLYIEAYGERSTELADDPAASAYAGTFLLEELLYAGIQGSVRGCEAPPQNAIVTARGSEPFWAVEVEDTRMVWRQADEPKEIVLGEPQTQDAEGAVRYQAAGQNHQVELMIDAQSCRDPMSGEFFAFAAKATLDGKPFSGCARVGK
jgi:uncharacterized membrane protein